MLRALRAEAWKLKRSRMPLWTGLIVLVAQLAQVSGVRSMSADGIRIGWATFMRSGVALLASWYGLVLFGLVAAYLFGREYGEGTAKEMLTLPLRREYIVAAKLVVLAGWVLELTLLSVVALAGYAALLAVDGATWAEAVRSLMDALAVSALIFATLPLVALLAMIGKGYLAPMAYSGVMASVGIALAEAGWTRWFPWSMQIAVTGVALFPSVPMPGLVPGSWALSFGTFAVGIAALFWYVDNADSAQ
jgi:ABC-2 type transport system permease protein